MDSKKQAYIANALKADMNHLIPILEGQVSPFIRSFIPKTIPDDKLQQLADEGAATVAQASDTWDKEHSNG